jgi:hypothetical protein
MFCSGCGQALAAGQPFCPRCGRPAAPAVPPIPGFEFQVETYASKVKALSIVWFIYAGLSLLVGIAGLTFAHAFLNNHFGNWGHGPWPNGSAPEWFVPSLMHIVWFSVMIRAALALVTAWGLLERAQWGRIVAVIAAFLSLFRFPFGTALGIWTLVVLLGYRNATLYEQLQ